MTDDQLAFLQLMDRVRAGSADAVRELIDTYGRHVLRVVRRRLNKRLRPKFDSTDFTQSVWASFFTSGLERHSFERPEDLIAFLGAVAGNKVTDEIRQRLRYRQHNVGREQSLQGSAAREGEALAGPGPTPSEEAMARECWDRMQQRATRPGRRILGLLRQGVTHEEIARKLRVDVKTVQRLVRNLGRELDE
jgi:RNA polymerase sigma factor (sigma-70 family)